MTTFRINQQSLPVLVVPQFKQLKWKWMCVGYTDIEIKTEPDTSAWTSMGALREENWGEQR